MQRKAIKQLNKVTQWTNEKVFSGEKTQYSEEFAEFEEQIEPLRLGIERLHATSGPFVDQFTKLSASADPYPPSGSNKDKSRPSEALGLVMIDYGNDAGGSFGEGLVKYGRARCRLAALQEDFSERLKDGYMAGTESALVAVNEYKQFRKKMDSRRLTLDSALHRQKVSKKDNFALDQEVELAQQRFDEAEEETHLRMINIKQREEEQFAALTDFLEAELEYYSHCKDILEELQSNFPTEHEAKSSSRPRAKSNASARSAGKTPTKPPRHVQDSDDEPETTNGRSRSNSVVKNGGSRSRAGSLGNVLATPNRERSDSGASAGKGRRSIMSSIGSIGSFGVKSSLAAANAAGKQASKAGASAKKFGKTKYGNLSEEERVLDSDAEDDDMYDPPSRASPSRPSLGARARSHSVVNTLPGTKGSGLQSSDDDSLLQRKAATSPPSPEGYYRKALFDFEGRQDDELPLKRGQIVHVTKEVNADWCIGEIDGRSGMFPKAYTEEHVFTPRVASPLSSGSRRVLPPIRAPIDRRRSLGPTVLTTALAPATRDMNSPTASFDTESEFDQGDLADNDNAATSLTSATAPTARSRAGSAAKKPPPPPPSRRAGSSNNLAGQLSPKGTSPSLGSGYLSPTRYGRSRSNTASRTTPLATSSEEDSLFVNAASPFAHSDDELVDAHRR